MNSSVKDLEVVLSKDVFIADEFIVTATRASKATPVSYSNINKEKIEKSFVVFCQIKLIQHKHEYVTKFEREVIKFEEVLECFNVSGEYDYILKIVVKDMKAYRKFLNDKLTTLDHISSTHSTFIINEVKNNSTMVL